jgi:tRNA threonylcarbamoyladenosine biosynthesis protein TsaB
MPTILAIETSAELASCALLVNDAVIPRATAGVRSHSQSILPMVQELLREAGPGSFTGVRTACGVAQGLAYGASLPVLPMVTLAAMAESCRARCGATEVLAVLDARMGEVYWAQYRFDGAWREVVAPTLSAPQAVAPLAVAGLQACGNGFEAYADAFAGQACAAGAMADIVPHAREMALLAVDALAAGQGVPAAQAQPIYLRNKIAFTTAERLVINAAKAAA